ncbi:MAG: HD domain-containing protein [Thalassovita sp.]
MAFLTEACQLKQVSRQSFLQDLSRAENSGEHSWHVALYALVMEVPDLATPEARIEAITMLLLHDLVEIDAGDHPIDEGHDWSQVAQAEQRAATRLFGLLPADQSAHLRGLWDQFEAASSPAARAAKQMDHVQPMIQAAAPQSPLEDHIEVVRNNLATGRARLLHQSWPDMFAYVTNLLEKRPQPDSDLAKRITFLNEADRLKSIDRATRIAGGSRVENSAEHSWHLALYALVLAEHATTEIDLSRVIQMLLIHDLVEIDAGDAPIFGDVDYAAKEIEERDAAERLFGLLPTNQGATLLALWLEFEANATADAQFAKSLDRFQPPNQNLASGGGSWVDYGVSFDMVEQRVGQKIQLGAPTLWDWVAPQIQTFLRDLNR